MKLKKERTMFVSNRKWLLVVFVILTFLINVSFASAVPSRCEEACAAANYSIAKCSVFLNGCGPHGWVHKDAGGACGLFGIGSTCCCTNGYVDLDAAGMCEWEVKGNVHGGGLLSPYTCDFSDIVNYYCDGSGNLMLECRDCKLFGCNPAKPDVSTYKYANLPGSNYICLSENDEGACDKLEKVPQGNSEIWGYDVSGAAPSILCNNGAIDAGEECDGANIQGKTCADFGGEVSMLPVCNADCTLDTSNCNPAPPNCGNGVIDDDEECDGLDLGGKTCADFGASELIVPVCMLNCELNTTPCTDPSESCTPAGGNQCVGMAKQICQDANRDGVDEWVTVENPSMFCCDDGDCSVQNCLSEGGVWLASGSSPDYEQAGFCCGDDETDYGTRFGNSICIEGPKWITGQEGERYADNKLLFCEGDFSVCGDGYATVNRADHCDLKCSYYCEPKFDTWLDASAPEGINIFSEPLGEGEFVDSISYDLTGDYGCCPSTWCWNGEKCVENQIDEAGDLSVYEHPSTGADYRCHDGTWIEVDLQYNWDLRLRGYCPSPYTQCLVSHESYDNNNNPEAYFSSEKPQCIGAGQWILDYYCNENEWISRTSLIATKLLQISGNGDMELICGDYETVLNDYDYEVLGEPVKNYLDSVCSLNGMNFDCVNNFCVLRDHGNNQVVFGTSLNTPLNDPEHGMAAVLGIGGCSGTPAGPWDYVGCGSNVLFNPYTSIILFNKYGISDADAGWNHFNEYLISNFDPVIQAVDSGALRFRSLTGMPLKFDIITAPKLFSQVYLADYLGKSVWGLMEEDMFDWSDNKSKSYLVLSYEGFGGGLCERVNNYTAAHGRINCEAFGSGYVVLDARDAPMGLMDKWTDLTTKLSVLQP